MKQPPAHKWFTNPTFDAACRQLKKQEKAKKDIPLPPAGSKVYICSPYRGDIESNVKNALRYCRYAVERGYYPVCQHIYLTRFLDDNIPSERELGLSLGITMLRECREVWLFGNKISEGMANEIKNAKWYRIRIRRFREDLKEL